VNTVLVLSKLSVRKGSQSLNPDLETFPLVTSEVIFFPIIKHETQIFFCIFERTPGLHSSSDSKLLFVVWGLSFQDWHSHFCNWRDMSCTLGLHIPAARFKRPCEEKGKGKSGYGEQRCCVPRGLRAPQCCCSGREDLFLFSGQRTRTAVISVQLLKSSMLF